MYRSDSDSISPGAIVAFTFGGIILVVIFVLVFCCCCDECPIYHRLFSTGKNPGHAQHKVRDRGGMMMQQKPDRHAAAPSVYNYPALNRHNPHKDAPAPQNGSNPHSQVIQGNKKVKSWLSQL